MPPILHCLSLCHRPVSRALCRLGDYCEQNRRSVGRGSLFAVVCGLACSLASVASGARIYVDSRRGDDRLDGTSAERLETFVGPVRTLSRGLALISPGDELYLVNNGQPYLGGASLYSRQHSGTALAPFEINGNGAVLMGARPIEPSTWRMVYADVWRITPSRKGWYQLVMDGAAVPEVTCPPNAQSPPDLPEHAWCVFQGAIYYRPAFGSIPADLPLQLADEQTGLTLLDVEHVIIRNLTLIHFRQDGVHVADRCRNVTLENVVCRENGRNGMVVRGVSTLRLVNVTLEKNREESLLVRGGLAVVEAQGGTWDKEPRVDGATVE